MQPPQQMARMLHGEPVFERADRRPPEVPGDAGNLLRPAGGWRSGPLHIIPAGNEPAFAKLLDLTMLVVPGGQERTAQEYEALYAAGGFRLTRVVPTQANISVIEGALDPRG
jgi:hypothetical protein